MIDRLEILTSRLRQKLSHIKWTARFLGYPPESDASDEPGLVLIQVDGLGEDVLRRALADGRMPFLKHLVEEEGYQLQSLYSGFPSSTPAFQAELFYGHHPAVPAFGFRDPELGRVVSMNDPGTASTVEERLEARYRGLLEGGSAWSNIFSGGAKESHLCASTAGLGAALRALAPRRLLGVMVWHFWSALRVFANLAVIGGFAVGDLLRGRLSFRDLRTEIRFIPVRVAVSAIMREVVTTGAGVDAERGLPIIQLNFLGYDEHAHRRGPHAWLSRWSLKGIDRCIRRVWMAAHRSRRRDYQVWVYSDHGQEAVTPYETRHGESVPKAVERVYRRLRRGGDPLPEKILRRPPRSARLTEGRFRWLGVAPPDWTVKTLRAGNGRPPDTGAVEVVNQGPCGFAYLDGEHEPGFREHFARALVRDAHIPATAIVDGEGRTVVYHRNREPSGNGSPEVRRALLPDDAGDFLGNDHPHLGLVARDIIKVLETPGAGDVMLMGWNPADPLSLQDEHGAHGGPGPRETSAFVVVSPEAQSLVRLPESIRPRDLRMLVRHWLAIDVPERPIDPPGPVAIPVPQRTDEGVVMPLRIMTYNVHGCRGMDGKYAPERIARVIAREKPDVVCLQELDQERTRSRSVDQVEVIARRLQTEYHFHAVAEVDDGRFGNAVLSLLPITVKQAGPLPSAPRAKNVFHLEDRGALWVEVDVAGCTLHLVNTHLSILARERRLQAEALLGKHWLGHPECKGTVVLTGDFNAAPRSWTLRHLATRLRPAVEPERRERALRTWSGRVPLRRIDHVLVSRGIEVQHVHVPRTRLSRVASDHLPLVVDLMCTFPAPVKEGKESSGAPVS